MDYTPEQLSALTDMLSKIPVPSKSKTSAEYAQRFQEWEHEYNAAQQAASAENTPPVAATTESAPIIFPRSGFPQNAEEYWKETGQKQGFAESAGRAALSEAVLGLPRIATNIADLTLGTHITKPMTEGFNSLIGMGPEDKPMNTFGKILGTLAGFAVPMAGVAKGVGLLGKAAIAADSSGSLAMWAFRSPNTFRLVQHVIEGGVQELTTEEPSKLSATGFVLGDFILRSRSVSTMAAKIFKPATFKTLGSFTKYWDVEEMRWLRVGDLESFKGTQDAFWKLATEANTDPQAVANAFTRPVLIDLYKNATEGMKETFLHKSGTMVHLELETVTGETAYHTLATTKDYMHLMDDLLEGAKIKTIAGPERLIDEFKRTFTVQHPSEMYALLNTSIKEASDKIAAGATVPTGSARVILLNTATNVERALNIDDPRTIKAVREGILNNVIVVKFENLNPADEAQVGRVTDFVQQLYGKRLNAEIKGVYYGEAGGVGTPTATFRIPFPSKVEGEKSSVLMHVDLTPDGNLLPKDRTLLAGNNAELVAFNLTTKNMQDMSFRLKLAENLKNFAPTGDLYRTRAIELSKIRARARERATPETTTPAGTGVPTPPPEGGGTGGLGGPGETTTPAPSGGAPGLGGPPGGAAPEGTPGATPPSEMTPASSGEVIKPLAGKRAIWHRPDGTTEEVRVLGESIDARGNGNCLLSGRAENPPISQIEYIADDIKVPPTSPGSAVSSSVPGPPVSSPRGVSASPVEKPQNLFQNIATDATQAGYSEEWVLQTLARVRTSDSLGQKERAFMMDIVVPRVESWMRAARKTENPETINALMASREGMFTALGTSFRSGDLSFDNYLMRMWLTRQLPDDLARGVSLMGSTQHAIEKVLAGKGAAFTAFLKSGTQIHELSGQNMNVFLHELGEVVIAQLNPAVVKRLAEALIVDFRAMLTGKEALNIHAYLAKKSPAEVLASYIGERLSRLTTNPSAAEAGSVLNRESKSALGAYVRETWNAVREVFGRYPTNDERPIFRAIDEALADAYWGTNTINQARQATLETARKSKEMVDKLVRQNIVGSRLRDLSDATERMMLKDVVELNPNYATWASAGRIVDRRASRLTREFTREIKFDTMDEAKEAERWYINLLELQGGKLRQLKRELYPSVEETASGARLLIPSKFGMIVSRGIRPNSINFNETVIKPIADLGEAGVIHADRLRDSFKRAAQRVANNARALRLQDQHITDIELRPVVRGSGVAADIASDGLMYDPSFEVPGHVRQAMHTAGVEERDLIYGFDDFSVSPGAFGRFTRFFFRNQKMTKNGIVIKVIPEQTEKGIKWNNIVIRYGKGEPADLIDRRDDNFELIADALIKHKGSNITEVDVFEGTEAANLLSKFPQEFNVPRVYVSDPQADKVFWYLRSSKDSFDQTVDRIITTDGYMQRAGQYVDDVAGTPPPEVRAALELGYELVGVSGKLPEGELHAALEKSIAANVRFPRDAELKIRPDQVEAIRTMALQAGLQARLTENGIELTRVFNPRGEAPTVVNSLDDLRNALGKVGLEPDLVFDQEQIDVLAPFLQKVARLTGEVASTPDPALPNGTLFARKVQEGLSKLGLPTDEPSKPGQALKGVQNLGFVLSGPMYYLTGRLQKLLPDFPIWDLYQRAHMGFKYMEHFAAEDMREMLPILNRLSQDEQRIVTHYLMAGGGGRTLTPGETAILKTFETEHKNMLTDNVKRAANDVRKWFDEKGIKYDAFRRPEDAPYIDAYVPWRALNAPRIQQMGEGGVQSATSVRPAADAWFTKARLEVNFNPLYDDRIGSLMAQYALGGRRMEHLVPASRDMVDMLKQLEELAAQNNGQLPSQAHLFTKWALKNMNNVITGQDGPISSLFYGGMYKMIKSLTGSTKLATAFCDNLLSWGYGVGLGFRPGSAARNVIFAPVPIFTMLGGRHLANGIAASINLFKSGKASYWAKFLDPINTNFARSFLDSEVPIYKYISGGRSPDGLMAKALRAGLWMQEASERVNRTVAYMSGISSGEEVFNMFSKTKDLAKVLNETPLRMFVEAEQRRFAKALVDGNKEEFMKQYAASVVRLTQFAYGPIESFMMGNTKGGKLLFFYGTWSANMLHFLGRAAGATVEDGRFRPLSPHGIKFLTRWAAATGVGWTTFSLMGMNPRSTFALGPTSYTGSPYMQAILDFADWMREPGKASDQARLKFLRRTQQLLTPFGAAVSDGRKALEDVQADEVGHALTHVFIGTTPLEEANLAKEGVRVHSRGWGF